MCAPDAPDTSAMQQAAKDNVELGREALAWWKDQAKAAAPMIQRAADRADQISLAQLDSMNTNTKLASDYDQYRRTTFQPVEQALVKEAMDFDTEAKREELAGLARGDTAQAFGAARDQLRRSVGAVGGNPSDPGFVAAQASLAGQEALADSFSRNKARADARTVGRAMKMDAAALGRNLPSQQATSAQIALSAGNSAANTGAQPVALAQQGAAMGGQGYGTAIQANQSAANIYGNVAGIQQKADDNSGLWGAAGNVLGAAAGAGKLFGFSDEEMKEGIEPVDGEVALAAVRKMPVKKWRYKKGSPAADGGQEHIGPMAQDVQAAMGDEVAPGGKVVDVISLAGTALAATKELDRRVIALERKVA